MLNLKPFFLTIFINTALFCFGQEKELYNWFDLEVGVENSNLFNGVEFINMYLLEDNEHRFFEIDSFRLGNLTYNSQNYYQIPLKYDLHQDQLIAMIETKNGSANQILLLKEKIANFEISDSYFEKIKQVNAQKNTPSGFYQLLVKNDYMKLYKKNQKYAKKILKNSSVRYKFIEEKPEYFILTEDKLFQIKKIKDLVSIYPEYKKELSSFKWNSNNKKLNDVELILAITKLGNLLKNN